MKKVTLGLLIIISSIGCKQNEIDKTVLKNITNSILTEYSNPPKLISFNNVENLRKILLKSKESTEFNGWRLSKIGNQDEKWSSNTNITQFGPHSKNGIQNDIGYSIFGKQQNFVNEIQLILNIKNQDTEKEALSELEIWSELTLNKLGLKNPLDLKEKILNGKQYYFENESCYIILKKSIHKEKNLTISKYPEIKLDKIIDFERWKLIIKSK